MIKSSRSSNISRRRFTDKPAHSVWAERRKGGGYDIFLGVKGTDIKERVSGALSQETLKDNLERAKHKYRHKI